VDLLRRYLTKTKCTIEYIVVNHLLFVRFISLAFLICVLVLLKVFKLTRCLLWFKDKMLTVLFHTPEFYKNIAANFN